MKILIECLCCHECITKDDIVYKTHSIPATRSVEELENFAEETGVEFDCPQCEERMYLSDCELF